MAHKGRSKTSKFLRKNPKSAAKKRKYDKEYRKREKGSKAPNSAKKRRLNKEGNRRWAERKKRGIANKKGTGDISHKKDGSLTVENKTKNRGRNGKNGRSTKK
tara:strand:- start:630 stop:938 length:309 start_codon:yes stop_codon:yes gene_type:complete